MEKLHGRYINMALEVARIIPDYIWKLEEGGRSIEIEARTRAGDYKSKII